MRMWLLPLGRRRERGLEKGRETSQEGMVSRQEWAVSSQCTGMINHACAGSRSKAALLFTGANEAFAATHSESECCGGGGNAVPEQKAQREMEVAFSIICHGDRQHQNHSIRIYLFFSKTILQQPLNLHG